MKKPQIIALILIAIATSFFVLNLDSGGSYGSFTQAKNKPDNEFTVAGELNQNKQIVYSPKVNANYFSFFMHDKKGNEMQVILNEPMPQDFEKSEEIVVKGRFREGKFYAHTILLKCPSKYKENNAIEA